MKINCFDLIAVVVFQFFISLALTEDGLEEIFGQSSVFSDLTVNDYQSCLDSLSRFSDLVTTDSDATAELGDVLTVNEANKSRSVFLAGITEPKLWPGGRIPLVIANEFTDPEKRHLICALKYFHENTCIRFVPRRCTQNELTVNVKINVEVEVSETNSPEANSEPEAEDSSCYRDYVYITKTDPIGGCFSEDIGRKGGRHVVNLGPPCWKHGTLVHELMHVAGIFHEHSRNDRDSYVTVDWERIPETYKRQFQTANQLGIPQRILGPYDYRSIMHYPSEFWDTRVLSAKMEVTAENNIAMGNRDAPTRLDTAKINKLYSCPTGRIRCSSRFECCGQSDAFDPAYNRSHWFVVHPMYPDQPHPLVDNEPECGMVDPTPNLRETIDITPDFKTVVLRLTTEGLNRWPTRTVTFSELPIKVKKFELLSSDYEFLSGDKLITSFNETSVSIVVPITRYIRQGEVFIATFGITSEKK